MNTPNTSSHILNPAAHTLNTAAHASNTAETAADTATATHSATGDPGAAITAITAITAIEARLASLGSAIVAFSGGVDSSVVAALAARALGRHALAVTAVSPALASGELDGARSVAASLGIEHLVISTDELARTAYRANEADRCYHCKSELYDRLGELAAARGFAVVLSGANADDLGDWRPGLRAAAEHDVRHPLVEASVGKSLVRAIAAELGVPSAAKPASPCLASRIPHGTPVDRETLERIDRAEIAVRALGYAIFRVRHYGPLARLEVCADELDRALVPQNVAALAAAVRTAGYEQLEIDPQPFRSGNLTVHLSLPTRR